MLSKRLAGLLAATLALSPMLSLPLLTASAVACADDSAPQANPQVVVQTAIDALIARVSKDRKILQKSPTALNNLVEQNITPFVDIPGIARGVMGQFYRQASADQRDRFTNVLKQSMVNAYATGLTSYNNQKIVVKPYKPGDDMNRAQVDVEVTMDNGNVVPVTFQMVRDGNGAWKARNLLINGLNLGLTYRKRFAEVVEQASGNLDKAISTWTPGQVDANAKDKS